MLQSDENSFVRFSVTKVLLGATLGLSFFLTPRALSAATADVLIVAESIGTSANIEKNASGADTLEKNSAESFKDLSEGSEGNNNIVLEEGSLNPKNDGSIEGLWASSAADSIYVVRIGDSLGSIAQDRYGDLERHRMIYEENRDRIVDPNRIYPGQKLVLPETP